MKLRRSRRDHPKFNRRGALATAAAGLLLATLTGLSGAVRPGRRGPEGLWTNRDSARRVGERYLAQAPEEADPARLAADLFGGVAVDGASPRRLRRHIDHRRARDFAQGDTVIVDGWVMARTEARLCALAALT